MRDSMVYSQSSLPCRRTPSRLRREAITWTASAFLFFILCHVATSAAQQPEASDERRPIASAPVGFPSQVKQVLIPGTELVARPVDSREAKLVVRVLESFAHGDSYRYDLEFTGLEPGLQNLCQALVRADGSSTENLSPIYVEISSQLPPGQVKPHELQPAAPRVIGWYTGAMIAAAGLWLLGLFAILFWGRAKERTLAHRQGSRSVADRLRPFLEQAARGELAQEDRAALERVLLAFWRKKLRLDNLPPAQLFAQLKQHPEAAALLVQMEQWLHAPAAEQAVDWQALLAPYRSMNFEELELS